MTGPTAGSHVLAGERGGEWRRARRGSGRDDGPAQVTEGREERGRTAGLLLPLMWVEGEEMSPVLIFHFPFLFLFLDFLFYV